MNKRYMVFRISCFVIAVALLVAMWFFSSQNGEESSRLSGSVTGFLLRLFGIEASEDNLARAGYIVRKAAHFGLFILLGLSLGFAFAPYQKPFYAFLALPVTVISAIADEFHQTFIAGRAGMWQDTLIDAGGSITGILMAFAILLIVAKRKTQKHGN